MKSIDIVSKIVAREGEAKASPSKGIQSINLSDYLLKSVWDKVFEVRTDSQGAEYIFGKLPVVTQYGITMYSGDGVNVPSLASGLPFDGRTIWYNPDTQQIEVIGGTGGGSGEGVSNFWDLSGIPSWITISKPKYTYSEIEGTPDLSKYALASQIPSLSGYATESWVLQKNYATKATTLRGYGITDAYTKMNVDELLKSYVTLGGTPQTITGEKNFTGGLKVNGSPIYYDTEKKYWKLEGDLLVTGGVTMYGSDSSFTPSTIMDAIAVDGTTISKSGGVLKVIGGTGGGVADSVDWGNITGKPTWIGSSKPTYSYSEITGAISTTELQNYLTSNSYLNVTSGDNRYLKLSGGEISSTSATPLTINTSKQAIELQLKSNSSIKAYIGWNVTDGVFLQEGESIAYIGVQTNKTPYYFNGTRYTLWHEGNFNPSNYLPLSGGTLDGVLTLRASNSSSDSWIEFSNKSNSVVHKLGVRRPESTYGLQYYNGSEYYKIWHEGNDGSGSGLDADLLDGQEETTFAKWKSGIASSGEHRHIGYAYGANGWITSGAAMSFGESENYFMQIQGGGNEAKEVFLYARYIYEGIYSDWKTIAFTDSNVASATYSPNTSKLYSTDIIYSYGSTNPYYGYLTFNQTYGEWDFKVSPSTPEYIHVYSSDKLRTARTIWGQSFDGTGNVSGNILLGVGSDYVIGTGYSSSDKRTFNNITIGNSTSGIIYNGGTWTGSKSFNAHTFTTGASSNALVINNGGNVGIGTTSPSSLLHVNGDGRITDIHFRGAYINLNRDGSTSAIYDSGKTALEIEATSGVSILRTYNVTRQASIVLHTNGNIGIGTLSPSAKLHVAGNFQTNDVWIGSDTGTYIEGTQTGGLRIQYANSDKKYTQIHLKDLTVTINNNLLCSGGITMYSDQRKKTILNHVELSLKQIAEAPLIEHYYNSDEKKTTHVGSIAQYWASMNDWFCKLDNEGYYTMEIQNAALASAISIARELDRYETKTDKAIKKLKKRICELEEEVERLKRA